MEPLELETLEEPGSAIVVCRGEIDLATSPLLSRTLRGLGPVDVILDFAEVEFIDSAGVYAVMNGLRRATRAGRGFVICCAPPPLFRVLQLMGLEDTLDLCPTREGAREAARAAAERQRVRLAHLEELIRTSH